MTQVPRVVLLMSQVRGHGGIPRYNRLFCRAVMEYEQERGIAVELVSLNDPPGWHDQRISSRPVLGFNGSRVRFAAAVVASLWRRHAIAVVGHVDIGPVAAIPGLLRHRAFSVTIVHGREVWDPLPWYKRFALRTADQIWAVSSDTAEQVVRHQGVSAATVHVVPNVLDPMLTDITAQGAAIKSRLLTISRMTRADTRKGVDKVIAALPAVRLLVEDVDYLVIGEGDDVPRLRELAEAVGVSDIVRFAGAVDEADLHRYLKGTDVFVLPSTQEGFGIVFLEAMAHARPVIAGDHGGSPEVVEAGKTGFLVAPNDQSALVAAIATLLRDPELRRGLGEAGANRVRRVFPYDRLRDEVFTMLDHGLRGSR